MKEQFSTRTIESSSSRYYKDRIEKEQFYLKEFFAHYLPTDFHPKSIIDFCCGIANEEPILYEMYGQGTALVSFDNSDQMIQQAKDLVLNRKSIIKLDVNDFSSRFHTQSFDLFIGRNVPINPNRPRTFYDSTTYPDIWPNFLENIKNHLNPDAYLFMTFARIDEFERATETLENLNYNIIIQEKNKIVIPSDHIGIAGADIKDNYVVMATLQK